MNANFYSVKLNAEQKDSLIIDGKLFVNPNPTANRSTHQIAEMLLNNRMSYPSYVFMDEMGRPITIVPGFLEVATFIPIIHYFGDNEYFKKSWEVYQKEFGSKK
jgi:thioredoxin-related protein